MSSTRVGSIAAQGGAGLLWFHISALAPESLQLWGVFDQPPVHALVSSKQVVPVV